jgi:hypothetical protein
MAIFRAMYLTNCRTFMVRGLLHSEIVWKYFAYPLSDIFTRITKWISNKRHCFCVASLEVYCFTNLMLLTQKNITIWPVNDLYCTQPLKKFYKMIKLTSGNEFLPSAKS